MLRSVFYSVISTILLMVGIRKFRERKWGSCKNNVQLNDKVAIITGANTGIGYEIAKELAARNAQVILACRNPVSAKEAIEQIEQQLENKARLIAMELDLASLKSIKRFAMKVKNIYPKIHLLINNAGVAYPKNQIHQTQDGLEIHFGVNHLGHFYLTKLLLETLKQSVPSRIIIVSSSLHERGEIDFSNVYGTQKPSGYLYANSKLANIYFCRELAKRLGNVGVNVYAICPGWAYTSLFRHSIRWYHYIFVSLIALFFMRSARQGSQTAIYCATDPSLDKETGLIYRDCTRYISKVNFDDTVALKLWEESERLINERLK